MIDLSRHSKIHETMRMELRRVEKKLVAPRVLLQMSGCWKGKQEPRTHSSMSWHVGTARVRSQKKPAQPYEFSEEVRNKDIFKR